MSTWTFAHLEVLDSWDSGPILLDNRHENGHWPMSLWPFENRYMEDRKKLDS